MNEAELAERLASADDASRAALLQQHRALAGAGLAGELKAVYVASVGGDQVRASGAAAALRALAEFVGTPEVRALAAWTAGLAALQLDGEIERALGLIKEAEQAFSDLHRPLDAAATQVSKVYALAMLGRYDEAIAAGVAARDVFIAEGDLAAAGRVEQNLGNIHFRRDHYHEAEALYRAARVRFEAVHDEKQLAQIDNCLATALKWQHDFRAAAPLYEQALARAEAAGMEVTRAEIERNLGCLGLFQGRYGIALDYLERARRRYAALGMPHRSAGAEHELADAYLELNLVPEAIGIYARVIPAFEKLGMRAEQAAALAQYGRACLLLGRTDEARGYLAAARTLYRAEGNAVGEAAVNLSEARLLLERADYEAAAAAAESAEGPFASEGAWRRLLQARWLRAEIARAAGRPAEAQQLLEAVLRDAEAQTVPAIVPQCHTSLGMLNAARGDVRAAEASFRRAIELTERLRAPLPAEGFRTAFVADKLTPYVEIVKLCLDDPAGGRGPEALEYVERARSRALMEMLGGQLEVRPRAREPFEAGLVERLQRLREDLNWFYSQANRPPEDGVTRDSAAVAALQHEIGEREAAVLEVMRQLQQGGSNVMTRVEPLDLAQLQTRLARDTALVEYYSVDDELLAFVVTGDATSVVRRLASEREVDAAVAQLRFQVDSMRHGARQLRPHLGQLAQRARHYLRTLYDLLIRPLEGEIGDRRVVVVPNRSLHYLPFHALHDGETYLIEGREVCYAPSAGVLTHLAGLPRRPLRRALLLGVPGEQTPRVADEVRAIEPLFPETTALLGDMATLSRLREQAPACDVLHLACHGQFRPDNPLFSSLKLDDGWLTVADAYNLELHCELVTLSACETGMSAVAPGDELIGLARGFFFAGSPALLVSLWTVDDESTSRFMTDFYSRLRDGQGAASALRGAQCALLKEEPHPFFWSPFVLMGRW